MNFPAGLKRHWLLLIVAALNLSACGSGGGAGQSDATSNPKFSVSGTVSMARNSDVDNDLEQRFAGVTEVNNDLASAQAISNPVALGGYLSGTEGGYAPEGSYQKDLSDFFQVALVQDQQLSLSVFYADTRAAAAGNIGVTLYLRPAANPSEPVATLEFTEAATKTLSIPATGNYYLELAAPEAVSAPVLYTLSLSTALSGSALSVADLDLNARFVPGEVLVQFKDQAVSQLPEVAALASGQSTVPEGGLSLKRNLGQSAHLYEFSPASLSQVLSFEASLPTAIVSVSQQQRWRTLKAIEQLRQRPDVAFAEPNYIRSACALPPNDPEYAQQWSLPMLVLPAAWEVSTGAGVRVAVIDTGIDADHLDLKNNIDAQNSYDFILDDESAGDPDPGMDSDPRDLGEAFHGSHVAGIIAAEGNNGVGVVGVAYQSSLMILRALGVEQEGTDADISTAILYAAGLANASGRLPSHRADIVNLSFGSSTPSQTMHNAINAALAEGLIVVAAAGNSGSSESFYPAAFDGVIAVSSVNDHKTRSSFSNYGTYVDVAAPGGTGHGDSLHDGFQDGILSTLRASEYGELVGTSMAAAHVSGVAALMKAVDPSVERSRFAAALASGEITEALGNPQWYGMGLINAAQALRWVGQELPPSLNVFPSRFGFIGANTQALLSLANTGSGTLSAKIEVSEPWLEVFADNVDVNGLGNYVVRIDGSAFALNTTGTGQLTISYQINGGPVEIQELDVFVSNSQQADDTVGQLLVYLLTKTAASSSSAGDREPFAVVGATLNNGVYHYLFSQIPPGEYWLKASTDNDGDFELFDEGEARGVYPLFAQAQVITVLDQNQANLDFEVHYPSLAESSALGLGVARK